MINALCGICNRDLTDILGSLMLADTNERRKLLFGVDWIQVILCETMRAIRAAVKAGERCSEACE